MSEQTTDPSGVDPVLPTPASAPAVERRVRRTTLSTGFSDVPGKTCAVCGYQGFRWQTLCPQGHTLT
jgi:hypothetical protein